MQFQSFKNSLHYVLPAVLVGLFAWGYTSAAGTNISVCVQRDGDMRMVGVGFTTSACKRGETLVSWNIQGPKGDKGDKGDVGVSGSKGDKGDTGAQGLQGVAGINGVNGQGGVPGAKGDKGDQGVAGQNGASVPTLHLQDGDGQDLGVFIGSMGAWQTYVPLSGIWANFQVVNSQGNTPNPGTVAYVPEVQELVEFTETGCTGTPFIAPSSAKILGVNGAVHTGTRFFKLAQTSPSFVDVKSYATGANVSTCVNELLVHASRTELVEIPTPFTEPIVWPLKVVSQ